MQCAKEDSNVVELAGSVDKLAEIPSSSAHQYQDSPPPLCLVGTRQSSEMSEMSGGIILVTKSMLQMKGCRHPSSAANRYLEKEELDRTAHYLPSVYVYKIDGDA
jgi:hypothetical protein